MASCPAQVQTKAAHYNLLIITFNARYHTVWLAFFKGGCRIKQLPPNDRMILGFSIVHILSWWPSVSNSFNLPQFQDACLFFSEHVDRKHSFLKFEDYLHIHKQNPTPFWRLAPLLTDLQALAANQKGYKQMTGTEDTLFFHGNQHLAQLWRPLS